MKLSTSLLKKILVDTEIITQKDFELAKKEATDKKESLEEIVLDKGLVSDPELGSLIADELGFPFINLRKVKIKREVLDIVPEIVAKKQRVIVFDRIRKGLKVAMDNPDNLEIREFIERKTGEEVIPCFATKADILVALKYYKKEIKEEFEELIGKTLEEFEQTGTEKRILPVIKMVELILNYGYENRASDVHLEPYDVKTILRYRIDGILHDVLTLPKKVHGFLVSRVKILARLRTDVREAVQDGHFSFKVLDEKVDVRVSVVPIKRGEKVVLRLLTERAKRFNLKEIGLIPKDLITIRKNIEKPWGMILAAGPTGCGKTTTLYALLKILNVRQVNICTIEDPIEYDVEGINQIQVNLKTNLTFSRGLKAIIRQDPNIIMVGEIRDVETAKLAINAAMTGHLVLSTFHSIDAASVFPRLQDMEVESFIVASTINIAIAQRLVRRICQKCIESYEKLISELEFLLPKKLIARLPKTKRKSIRLFRGKGCPVCQNTGYLGRIGIFEILQVDETMNKLIAKKPPSAEIKAAAVKSGMTTMIEDGLAKVEKGITTIEEILKAVR